MDLKQLLNQTTIDTTNDITNDDQIETVDNNSTVDYTVDSTIEEVDELDELDEGVNEEESDNDIDPRFKHPWNKLEKGQKLNRILLFITQETADKGLSDNLSKELKNILFNACDRGLFNKITEVEYDEETCIITSFKCLEFNELTKKYKLKSKGVKTRSVSKSRSNIDRLMKKK
jgi:hypothetical protein